MNAGFDRGKRIVINYFFNSLLLYFFFFFFFFAKTADKLKPECMLSWTGDKGSESKLGFKDSSSDCFINSHQL